MAIRSWLQKIGAAQSDKARAAADASKARPNKGEAISYAVSLSGLVNDQPGTLAFYRATFADHPRQFVTYRDLRKLPEFVSTLNDRGRADPLGAASVIGLAISTALCTLRDIAKMEAAGIDRAKFRASSMAAGPCAAAAKLDGQTIPLSDAPMLPFDTCPHPDQCACRYQAWLAMLDD